MEVKFIPHRTAAKNAQSTEKSSRRRYGQAWRRARRKFFMVERAPSADGGRGLSAGRPGQRGAGPLGGQSRQREGCNTGPAGGARRLRDAPRRSGQQSTLSGQQRQEGTPFALFRLR